MNRRGTLSRLGFQLLGVAFLLVVALFVAVSVGLYRKSFTPIVPVTLETDHVGSQLAQGADVKIRGVIVGEVRQIRGAGDHAVLSLALAPDRVKAIPRNVSAQLLPKTLFGERYVALQIPDHPSTAHLSAGDVIGQDRSSAAMEVEKVLDDLMPVLQAVQPQKLATTLTAVSQALDGRGQQLGDTLARVGGYLGQINPSLADFNADMKSLAAVSDVYNKAGPRLLQALSDLTTTSRTVVEQRDNLQTLYGTLTTASVDLNGFLEANRNNLINLTNNSEASLAVLAKYAPEYPCVLKQVADQIAKGNRTMGEGQQYPHMGRITIEFTQSRGKYVPGVDTPRFTDKRGPRCYDAPQPPNKYPQYPPDGAIRDGSTHPPAGSAATPIGPLGGPTGTVPQSAGGGTGNVPSLAFSPAERNLVALMEAPALGVMPQDVPNWAGLLVGPMFRGQEVEAR
ncbi:MCE family protein [Gandjariella thermophila]|uniref:ABC transporter substrate-binding protein n=1 Tax=Gandjariella thermophila TaxID=1931992 RepID=A0A4D4J7B5_9PSEU|nr:MCE family protein [Gandjariella thermophila]GDY29763.1 ABC transporter substrate-binding protein [Gandjariella thermophila]